MFHKSSKPASSTDYKILFISGDILLAKIRLKCHSLVLKGLKTSFAVTYKYYFEPLDALTLLRIASDILQKKKMPQRIRLGTVFMVSFSAS